MSDIPSDKKFRLLCGIVRAQHFAWREALERLHPDGDTRAAVLQMWEVTGRQTAEAYVQRIDRGLPLPLQVARAIATSSQAMGEDAQAQVCEPGGAAEVVHERCPWYRWHEQRGLLAEDREGCDRWFQSTVEHINQELGSKLRVETLEAMPSGDPVCRRRLWIEDDS